MKNKCFLSLMVLAQLNGCSLLGPDYVKPKIALPNQWIAPASNSNTSTDLATNLAELYWWKQFDDPQLNDLIQQALQHNNDIQLASANLQYAQAQLKQVKLGWIPGLNLWAGYSALPYMGDAGYFFGLFPSYILNIPQQIKKQKSAEYQVDASAYAQEGMRLTVIGQVSGSYFTLLAQMQSLKLYQQLLEDNQKLLSLYQEQYRAGIIPQDALDQQRSTIKKITVQIRVTQHNIFVSKNALRYLLNQNPGNIPNNTKVNATFEDVKSDAIIPGDLPVTVLKNRPDVQQAEAVLKSANADIGVATTNLLPSVKLDNFMIESSNAHGYVNLNEGLVNMPIVAPTVLGEIEVSRAEYKMAYTAYISTVRAALRDIENDFSGYSTYSQKLNDNQEAFDNERQQCQLSQVRYQQGIDSEVEVTQCAIKLDNFELTLNQDKLEKMMTLVALYQDLGGGYQ